MNLFSVTEMVGINCSDLNAAIAWHKSASDEITKQNVNEAQLMTYIRELNGGNLPNMGTNPTRSATIQQLLDIAATHMSYYDEHYWLVAKYILKRNADKITIVCGYYDTHASSRRHPILLPNGIERSR